VGLFYLYVVLEGLVRHTVRKNHRERFFMSDSEPVGQPTGMWAVILPTIKARPKIKKPPRFLRGLFYCSLFCIDQFVAWFDEFIWNEFEHTKSGT
jgi:hypothetical protein